MALYQTKPLESSFANIVEVNGRFVGKIISKDGDPTHHQNVDLSKEEFEAQFEPLKAELNPPRINIGSVVNPEDPGYEEHMAKHKPAIEPAELKAQAMAATAARAEAAAAVAQAEPVAAGTGEVA